MSWEMVTEQWLEGLALWQEAESQLCRACAYHVHYRSEEPEQLWTATGW
jgi:hypothetical protein